MPRFKHTNYDQTKMVPIDFKSQLSPGTFGHTLDYLIEDQLDLSIFDHRYNNDKTGATAYDPKILLKILLLAYSRGITSSRQIERLCRENIIFIAISCDSQPHFTTIADFVTRLPVEIESIFRDVLMICDDMGLIGKQMFAIDGCKMPSHASKEWSGARKQFQENKKKMEGAIHRILKKHRDEDSDDQGPPSPDMRKREEQQIETIKRKAKKYKQWLQENTDRPGKRKQPLQSNITDNDSAKLKSSHGVIQGFDGLAISDDKYQVIVCADAEGRNDERPSLIPMVEKTRNSFPDDPFKTAKFSGDSGFCDEANLKFLAENGIDGYVTDLRFRQRHKRFEKAERCCPKERRKTVGEFKPKDFIVDPKAETVTCPAGKQMWLKSRNPKTYGIPAMQFQARVADCKQCGFRRRCLRSENQPSPRQFVWFKTHLPEHQTRTKRMKKKIDTAEGKYEYSKRLAVIEPVFGNITSTLGLNRFSLRGKVKVAAQWLAFCLVHNIGKIQRYGMAC